MNFKIGNVVKHPDMGICIVIKHEGAYTYAIKSVDPKCNKGHHCIELNLGTRGWYAQADSLTFISETYDEIKPTQKQLVINKILYLQNKFNNRKLNHV
jgi:hypothetical protein